MRTRRGFTILELLVASLLLSMLVTILTMLFNQSSVAWTAGLSSVTDLSDERMSLGVYHDVEDDLLPGITQKNVQGGNSDNRDLQYRTVSLWKKGADNQLRKNERAFDLVQWGSASTQLTDIKKALNGAAETSGASAQRYNREGGVIVGVWSAGPDGKWDSPDDINTFPEEIN